MERQVRNNSCHARRMSKEKVERPGKKRQLWKILLVILVVLIAVRIALPYIVLDQANDRLKSIPGYYGHIDDITISLFRGAYGIHDYYLDKQDTVTKVRTPFVAGEDIDLSLEWKALFEGRIVSEIVLERPIVRFTKEYAEPEEIAEDTVELVDLLKDFMPIDVNRFEVYNGAFQFNDPTSSPQVHLSMENVEIHAENLSSVRNNAQLLPAWVSMDADVYRGHFMLDIDLDPLAGSPTFDLAATLEGTDLTLFNEFFQAYANFDVQQGTFGLYTEIAAKDGKFLGYVKPVIKDIEVLGPQDRDKSIGKKLWEGLVGLGGMLLTNPKEDQIATRVPLEGDLRRPDVRTWYAIIDLLRNAFIRALEPQVDNEINIAEVPGGWKEDDRGFFARLFEGEEGDDPERLERRKQRREDRRKERGKEKDDGN